MRKVIMRIIYLGYYFKQLDWNKYHSFVKYTSRKSKISELVLVWSSIWNSMLYNISLLEYFQFHFYDKPNQEKKKWAGTGYMYEFQRIMNPVSSRNILDDKRLFFQRYRNFFVHQVYSDREFYEEPQIFEKLKKAESGKIVIKASDGKCGAQVKILNTEGLTREKVISQLKEEKYDMVEEFIIQHSELTRLAPKAVNTVRIFTQLNDRDEVEILGCRQRLSIYSNVDNLAAGNIAAPIDEDTGKIMGPGIYGDISKEAETVHPVSGVEIVGFQVPFWKECLALAKKAALFDKTNRSIGWDIVVTEVGPGLIEGNHDWCKLVWQLPVDTGMKSTLQAHWDQFQK